MIDEYARDTHYLTTCKSLLETLSEQLEKAVTAKEILTLEEQLLRQVKLPLQRIHHHLQSRFYNSNDPQLQSREELQRYHNTIQEIVHTAKRDYFNRWRESIHNNHYSRQQLFRELDDCCDHQMRGESREIYDLGDVFIDELLEMKSKPGAFVSPRTVEMNAYGATPALTICEMVTSIPITTKDVFYDLGSGIGKVTMMVNLLAGATAVGVEYDAAHHTYAQAKIQEWGLKKVQYIKDNAAAVNYDDATIFFIFNSFSGTLLEMMQQKISAVAERKPITICTLNMEKFRPACPARLHHQDPRRNGLAIYKSM